MTINEIRKKYLEFFKEKGHTIIPSASLIPENDPSVLFTTAGMHPLVPFLMGEKHPGGKRLTSAQKCLRTGDIDEIGDSHHLTFFEMLGNWSLGDYNKIQAINWSWEFLTEEKWLGLDPKKLAISVFAGDKDCPFDDESYNTWKQLGLADERIIKLNKNDNWWPAGGKSIGPQGPDTEMFYWTGEGKAPKKFDSKDDRWFEIWNDVFMEYEKTKDGKYIPLKQKNIDTGLGLERTATILQNKKSIYEIESFKPIIKFLKSQAKDYQENSVRIIADHLRTAIFIMSEDTGIVPSNLNQGYVVRKLIRRAIRHAKKIGIAIEVDVTTPIVNEVVKQYKNLYPELERNKQRVIDELNKEEDCFEKTLERGLKEFKKIEWVGIADEPLSKRGSFAAHAERQISGKIAFDLYQTYGFPIELTIEIAKEQGKLVDIKNFNKEFKKHQELSRSATIGMFKGGLVDQSEQTIKYHTATHLLHQALRDVLGNHVEQRGSNITEKRLRFDFSHSQKLTENEKKNVEDIVNQKIKEALSVTYCEMNIEEAKKNKAISLFLDKYGEKVKVYSVGDYSKEVCGGPHVENTKNLGKFKIIKEEASSAGIRRIKAILE